MIPTYICKLFCDVLQIQMYYEWYERKRILNCSTFKQRFTSNLLITVCSGTQTIVYLSIPHLLRCITLPHTLKISFPRSNFIIRLFPGTHLDDTGCQHVHGYESGPEMQHGSSVFVNHICIQSPLHIVEVLRQQYVSCVQCVFVQRTISLVCKRHI